MTYRVAHQTSDTSANDLPVNELLVNDYTNSYCTQSPLQPPAILIVQHSAHCDSRLLSIP